MTAEVKNPCAEMGCAACCRDMEFIYISDTDRAVLTPPGTKVVQVADVASLSVEGPPTQEPNPGTVVYFHRKDNGVNTIKIVGPCPNLQADGACGAYDKRPFACRNFKFDSPPCVSLRKQEVLFKTIKRRPGMPS